MATQVSHAPQTPRPRRPLWRRLLRWTLFALLGLVVLLALLVGFLHTGPGQDLVRGIVADKLAERVNGTVELEQLEFSLFGGPLRLQGLTIRDTDGRDAIVLDALAVDLALTSLLTDTLDIRAVELDGLHVVAREQPDGTLDLATLFVPEDAPREPLDKRLKVARLAIADLDLTLEKADGSRITVSDLRIAGHLDALPAAEEATVELTELSLGLGLDKPDGTRIVIPRLATSAHIARRGNDLSARLADISALATVTAPAANAPPRTFEVALSIEAIQLGLASGRLEAFVAALDVGAARLTRLSIESELPKPGAPLALSGPQGIALEGLHVDAAELNALLGRRVLLSDVDLALNLAGPPEALTLTGTVQTRDAGNLAIEGSANLTDLTAPSYRLVVRGEEIATASLLALDLPPITSSLELTLEGHGATRETAEVDLVLAIGPTTIDNVLVEGIDLVARLERGRFAIQKLVVRAFGQELNIVGALESDQAFSAALKTATDVDAALNQLREARLLAADFELPVDLGGADIDLSVDATPRTAQTPDVVSALVPPELAAALPFATATLKGHVNLDDVHSPNLKAGSIDTAVDLRLDESGPFGTIAIAVDALDTASFDLDRLDAKLALEKDVLEIEVVGIEGRAVVVDLLANASVDNDHDELVLELQRARVVRGPLQTELLEPAILRLPRTIGQEPVDIIVPRIALSLAGGRLSLAGRARVHRDLPPADAPEGTQGELQIDDFDLALAFDRIDLRKAASMAGRKVPLEGHLGGTIVLRGTPANPDADIALDATVRARDEHGKRAPRAVDLSVRGAASRGRARLDVTARDHDERGREPLLTVHLDAPLRTDGTPGLAASGRLDLELSVPRRRIADLAPYLPPALVPATLDPDGTLAVALDLDGTPARPRGAFALELEGQWLSFVDPAAWRGRTQRLTVNGNLSPESGSSALGAVVDLELWLDRERERTVDAHLVSRMPRSPLVASRPAVDTWALELTLAPLDLARLPASASAPLPTGSVGATLALNGTERDLFGTVALQVHDLVLPASPLGRLDLELAIDLADALALDGELQVGGRERLRIDGTVGVAGHGLLARLRSNPRALRDSALELVLRIPEHPLADWASVAPALSGLPGQLGGELRVFDRISHPRIDGQLAWDRFDTLDGAPGALAVALALDDRALGVDLTAGGRDPATAPLALSVTAPRADLEGFITGAQARLPVVVEGRSHQATLRRLAPAFALDGDTLEVDGQLQLELDGSLALVRQPDQHVAPQDIDFNALLALTDGALAIPGSQRRFHDLGLVLRADPNRITLERLEAHERDPQRDDRAIHVQGQIDLQDLAPTDARLSIDVAHWLAVGPFDSPQAAITADIDVSADLRAPGKVVDVVVHDLFFDSTTRYPRGHYFRDLGQHDLIVMDQPGAPPVGKLAAGHGAEATVAADAQPAAALDPDAPVHVITVDIEKARAIQDVLVLEPRGRVVARVQPGALELAGRIDIVAGSLEFVGDVFPLERGEVTLGGPHGPVWLDLNFAKAPRNESRRALAGADERTTVQVLGDPVGNALVIRGAGGPILETAMSTHIGQTPLVYSAPDAPASSTVATPEGEMPLIQSFMGTNLPHMLFLDHAVAWADPYVWANRYGELRQARYAMSLHDGTGRLRVAAEPPRTAGSEAEVQYDWIWGDSGQAIYGMGARVGDRVAAGLEIFLEWSSID